MKDIKREISRTQSKILAHTGQKTVTMDISLIGRPVNGQMEKGTMVSETSSLYVSYTAESVGILQ